MADATAGPPVTLAVLTYMQESFVAEAVTSALAQDYQNIHFIFSDDSSTDSSIEKMKQACSGSSRAGRVLIRRTGRNLGFAEHINDVVAMAQTPFVMICAGDDVMEPDKVSKLLAPMLADDRVVATHSAVTEMTPSGELLQIRQCSFGERLNDFRFVVENAASVVIQSHACRREVFTRFPPFEATLTNEGIPITAREALLGNIAYVPEPLTRYRLGGTSTQIDVPTRVRQLSEPIKITRWGLSGLRQIQRDLDATSWSVPSEVRSTLDRRIDFYASLQRINEESWALVSLLNVLGRHRGKVLALRAFVRRNLPSWLYGLAMKLRD